MSPATPQVCGRAAPCPLLRLLQDVMRRAAGSSIDRSEANDGRRLLPIGAVVSTGLPANTIRTWERRHSIVRPVRSEGGGRLYRDEQVARLQLAAALCKAGESISAVAGLTTEELRGRLASHALARGHGSAPIVGVARVVIIHPTLSGQFAASKSEALRIVVQADRVEEVVARPVNRGVDVIFVSLDAVSDNPIERIEQLRCHLDSPLVVVMHGFATKPAQPSGRHRRTTGPRGNAPRDTFSDSARPRRDVARLAPA